MKRAPYAPRQHAGNQSGLVQIVFLRSSFNHIQTGSRGLYTLESCLIYSFYSFGTYISIRTIESALLINNACYARWHIGTGQIVQLFQCDGFRQKGFHAELFTLLFDVCGGVTGNHCNRDSL